MENLRNLRIKFQNGMISYDVYDKERIRLIDILTCTIFTAESSNKPEYDEDAFSKPFNEGTSVVLQVTDIQVQSSLPEGWHLGADGKHFFHMQKRADGTAYRDPRAFPGVKLHKI